MGSKATLDTPYKKGDTVVTTKELRSIASGSKGTIQLSNGLGVWYRYWVRFEDGKVMGQVSHEDLVRPDHLELWTEREEERRLAAERKASEPETAATEDSKPKTDGDESSGDSLASMIPEELLERSRAAKARLLG